MTMTFTLEDQGHILFPLVDYEEETCQTTQDYYDTTYYDLKTIALTFELQVQL